MSKRTGILPKLEILAIAALSLAFLLWAASRCSATRRQYQEQAERDAREQALLDSLDDAARNYSPLDTTMKPTIQAPKVQKEKAMTLYSTIDGLNVRSGPGLNYKILYRLKLYEEVDFLGEVTDSTEEINLGEIVAEAPWVKVKTPKGQQGWVYGAGVDYYKHKLEGVETEE